MRLVKDAPYGQQLHVYSVYPETIRSSPDFTYKVKAAKGRLKLGLTPEEIVFHVKQDLKIPRKEKYYH